MRNLLFRHIVKSRFLASALRAPLGMTAVPGELNALLTRALIYILLTSAEPILFVLRNFACPTNVKKTYIMRGCPGKKIMGYIHGFH